VLLVLPVALVGRQPDLGTAILIGSAGAFVIYFAGLSWRVILGSLVVGLAAMPLLWLNMKPYQKERVLTMIDPTNDPLGKGFHIIQSTIAVGSGGMQGKGWLRGTQAHLDFVPERTTDFIFSVYAELTQARNNADALVHSVEKSLKEHGDKIDADEKSKIESALEAAREAVKGDDKARIEETSNALTEAAQKLGEKVYAEAQAAAAGAAGAAGAAAGASSAESAHSTETAGDDVVDADFKEVKRD